MQTVFNCHDTNLFVAVEKQVPIVTYPIYIYV